MAVAQNFRWAPMLTGPADRTTPFKFSNSSKQPRALRNHAPDFAYDTRMIVVRARLIVSLFADDRQHRFVVSTCIDMQSCGRILGQFGQQMIGHELGIDTQFLGDRSAVDHVSDSKMRVQLAQVGRPASIMAR